MSNKLPKECSDCPNSKTVHLTQIVGGAVEKLAVCSACELASDADSPEKIDIICEMTVPAVPSVGGKGKEERSGLLVLRIYGRRVQGVWQVWLPQLLRSIL